MRHGYARAGREIGTLYMQDVPLRAHIVVYESAAPDSAGRMDHPE